MSQWARSNRARTCGRCADVIAFGDPILLITIGPVVKVRCAHCEGPPPLDLPDEMPRDEVPLKLATPLAGVLPFTRQPGEEG